jgi:hypothetical protein
MLEENSNPNTNNQVPESQCLPAGRPLAQWKRPTPGSGQSSTNPLGDQKKRRQATSAKYTQNNSKVNVNKALRSNLYAALGELASETLKNRNSRAEKGMTDMLVFLLEHVRLDDGTCFTVNPANEYEIIKVRGFYALFLRVRV